MISEYSVTGHARGRTGLTSPGFAPSNIYPTLDGHHIVIGANADTICKRLFAVMGMDFLMEDPRFSTHGARGQPDNQAEIDRIIGDWTATKTREELLKLLDGAPSRRAASTMPRRWPPIRISVPATWWWRSIRRISAAC